MKLHLKQLCLEGFLCGGKLALVQLCMLHQEAAQATTRGFLVVEPWSKSCSWTIENRASALFFHSCPFKLPYCVPWHFVVSAGLAV